VITKNIDNHDVFSSCLNAISFNTAKAIHPEYDIDEISNMNIENVILLMYHLVMINTS